MLFLIITRMCALSLLSRVTNRDPQRGEVHVLIDFFLSHQVKFKLFCRVRRLV